jgi:hypothetical protein
MLLIASLVEIFRKNERHSGREPVCSGRGKVGRSLADEGWTWIKRVFILSTLLYVFG